jgi:LacI family transcriptional regulator
LDAALGAMAEARARQAMKSRKTTMEDVAAAAGVSLATVDRVLNGRGGVRAQKARGVLSWARRLNIDRALDSVPLRWLRIAVVIQNPKNLYYHNLKLGFRQAQEAHRAQRVMCLVHYFPDLKPATIARTILKAAQNADGLLIVSYDHPEISAALRKVSRSIPVATLASDLPGSGRIGYVGSDNTAAGRVAGELLGRFLGSEGGEVLVVMGLKDFIGHAEREAGLRAVLERRFPNCRVMAAVESKERLEGIGRLVQGAFTRFPRLRGIYNISVGDGEIADSIARLGLTGNVVLVGHELTDTTRRLLFEGRMDAVIDQSPQMEALLAVELMLRHYDRLPGGAQPLETPIAIYLRESLPETALPASIASVLPGQLARRRAGGE